ncbi:acyl-CoA reductase [Cyclobacterium plantarum]|uniref:Acyl-CoA reductase n=1 Tax=Cyclobacterium plantarum TaxID=2716263 RepID=A0ABX0H9H4_9BACT|nr:acyl-CoA reductase [Cyclobacterium plantarum]NHE58329.1 acyl-CoA reductase [Cyclobacterium plantarum]
MNLNERLIQLSGWERHIKNLPEEEKTILFKQMHDQNSWFTPEQSRLALEGILAYLSPEKVRQWISSYKFLDKEHFEERNIGIIMAGNIPGVGFHDLLCVLLSGHRAKIKLSSTDNILIPWLVEKLGEISPELVQAVSFEERLNGMDAYIATGSDNSARYFDYYFGRYPHIIRKNRTSVAILDGNETQEDWNKLSKDIFQYYGLGCRNVSKIYVPNQQSLQGFLKGMEPANQVIDHHKYLNNYDYNKSKYLVNRSPHFDNGHLLLVESKELVSPIAVVYFEYYADLSMLRKQLKDQENKIQCMVSRDGWFDGSIKMGNAQCPEVSDYADKVDTLQFLLNLEQEIQQRVMGPQKQG